MRRRPVRNCGTVAETSDSAPPSPAMFAHGSVGVIVSVAVRETAPAVAVTIAVLPATAGGVVTVNVAVVAPAATVTEAGTDADAGALLESETAKPAAPAAAVSVTVPCDVEPAATLAGARPGAVPRPAPG